MAQASVNGIRIEYDTFGEPSSPALLLIMGLGAQMIDWDEPFCGMLADRGHFVIRFDNRDVGLSSKIEEFGVPNLSKIMTAALAGQPPLSPYTIDDMADDAVGLLDSLGIEKAHICGASMGGMIAQTIAYRHPDRVLSLISIMSTTGAPTLPPPSPDATVIMSTPSPMERQAYIDNYVHSWRVLGSSGFPFDEEKIRAKGARVYDRNFHPQGWARQMVAIMAHGDRTARLKGVRVPTLVIHGSDDPLVPVAGGKATAAAIAGAEMLVIDGMGHDFPEGAWPQLIGAISDHVKRAED